MEGKYGRINVEHDPGIEEDEPLFLLRAQDKASVATLKSYRHHARDYGAPVPHLVEVDLVIAAFVEWQDAHPDRMKAPD